MSYLTALTIFFKKIPARNRVLFPKEIQSKISKENLDEILLPSETRIVFVRENLIKDRFRPSALYMVETISPGKSGVEIEGVYPAAKVLLKVKGPVRIRSAISFFVTLSEKNVALKDLSDNLLSSIHSRIEAGISLEFLAERIVEELDFQ